LPGPAADLGLGRQVQSAQLKLQAALPAPMRGAAGRVSARLHLDPIEWYREAQPNPQLETVARAVWDERQLEIAYESWTRSTRQVVHPLGLVLKAGAWYLVATREQKIRTFRVSSITEARLLDGRSQRPRGFDLAKHWKESVQRFEQELYTGEAELLATADGLAQLRRLGAAVARALREVTAPPEGETVRVKIPIESVEQVTGSLLRLAPEVEAVKPAALRKAIAARIATAAGIYGLALKS